MCGIAGVFARTDRIGLSSREDAVARMLSAIGHRGPDEQGMHSDDHVTLGHARLSIIDLAGGSQPLFNEDRSCVLVYNGEVYDYQQLRDRLAARHQFATSTDSEVLLHLYEEEGESFPEQLNGMYAYALWDTASRRLHLAIDPVGIKPLYYCQADDCFVFCSELRGMIVGLRALGMTLSWHHEAIRSYLQLGWFPAPDTALCEVKKLLPGERLTLHADRGSDAGHESPASPWVESRCTPLPAAAGGPLRGPSSGAAASSLVDCLDGVLTEAVASQLVADVPVGVFLSGGIDSSLLTAIAGKIQPGIKTFSVGFSGGSQEVALADESTIAEAVAEHLGTEHRTLMIDSHRLLQLLGDAWLAMDEPIVDPAVLPLLVISRAARDEVKVCLSGDGGDEVFGGYPHHRLLPWKRRFHRAPAWCRSALQRGARSLPTAPQRGWREKLRRAGVGFRMLSDRDYSPGPFSYPHQHWLQDPSPYRHVALEQILDDDWYYVDGLLHPLAGQMLPKSDRVSMFASLELRVPLLDNRLLAFGRSVPFAEKVRGGQTKVPLRQLLARYLPETISSRPKQGFRVPLSGWFREELREEVRDQLQRQSVIPSEVISSDSVDRLIEEHSAGRAEHSIRLWALMTLSHWMSAVLEGGPIN